MKLLLLEVDEFSVIDHHDIYKELVDKVLSEDISVFRYNPSKDVYEEFQVAEERWVTIESYSSEEDDEEEDRQRILMALQQTT